MVVSALLSLIAIASCARADLTPTLVSRADSSASIKPITQLFEWDWKSIGDECTSFIGPAGYGYVQVSPPQEAITGSQWWTDYQPVSYQLISKRGDRAAFQSMVTACNKAGVKVIADTIWNHMAGIDNGTGTAGSTFSHYNYPGIYQNQDFHHCGLTPGDDIVNNTDRTQVQTCELTNLADLATDSDYVRTQLAKYGDDLVSLGVEGFRLDAAKMIASDDISAILGKLKTKPALITQEVIFGEGEQIQPSEYVQNGKVQEFRYTVALQTSFASGVINNLTELDARGWVPPASANVFVANHDTERTGASLNYTSANNAYDLAHVFMMAYPYGQPTILSGYTFSSSDDGAPNNGAGSCSGTSGSNGWRCQHRQYAGLVGLYNAVSNDTSITNYVTPSVNQIAFGRGSIAHVAINAGSSSWSGSLKTNLADGKYCDVVVGAMSGSSCAGSEYTVSSGSITVDIPANSAIAIHTGAVSGKAASGAGRSSLVSSSLLALSAASILAVLSL